MTPTKVVLLALLTTVTTLAALGGAGVLAARAAVADQPIAGALLGVHGGHGFGGFGGFGHHAGGPCERLNDSHVDEHAAELDRWVVGELTLDASQQAALQPVIASLVDWARELRPLCDAPRDEAPAKVALASRFTEVTQQAMSRFAAAFDAFYTTLDAEQQATIDGWLSHGHRQTHS